MGLEYLGFLIFIIYAGALSILFLFVVMLLDIRKVELQNRFFSFFSVCVFLGFSLFLQFYLFIFDVFDGYFFSVFFSFKDFSSIDFGMFFNFNRFTDNLTLFGSVLFNHLFVFVFFISLYLSIVVIILLLIVFHNVTYPVINPRRVYKIKRKCLRIYVKRY